MATTTKQVNKALDALAGVGVWELVRGDGYCYFASPDHMLFDSCVYVPRVGDLSVAQWVDELRSKIEYTNERGRYEIPTF